MFLFALSIAHRKIDLGIERILWKDRLVTGRDKRHGPVFDLEKQLADSFPIRKVMPIYHPDWYSKNAASNPGRPTWLLSSMSKQKE